MSSPYEGTVEEDFVSELVKAFGDTLAEAGEVGFILTYHAVNEAGTNGRMQLSGTGIDQGQLGILFARALDRNAEHGSTR